MRTRPPGREVLAHRVLAVGHDVDARVGQGLAQRVVAQEVRLGPQEVLGREACALGPRRAQDALGLPRLEVLRHVVEVQHVDLLVFAPLVRVLVQGLAQLVERRRQELEGERVEAGRVQAGAREVDAGGLVGEGGRRLLGVADHREASRAPASRLQLVQAVDGHVHGRVARQLDDLQVARTGERAHQRCRAAGAGRAGPGR